MGDTVDSSSQSAQASSDPPFAAMYEATAAALRAEFDRVRASLTHSGQRGAATEEVVRRFLAEALPASLGVAVGQVVDSYGNYSGQADVIIYDAQATPMLFSSVQGGSHTVPIEGVVAVIEVKSRLQRKDLPQLVEHARRVKSMERRAYLPRSIVTQRTLYAQSWPYLPVLYSVFAFNSDGLYVGELNEMQASTPLHLRVDNLCALDRGLAVNMRLEGADATPTRQFSLDATPTTGSILGEVTTPNSLMPWFAMNASLYVQADRPPINLAIYLQDQLRMDARAPLSSAPEFRAAMNAQFAAALGITVELATKLSDIVGHRPSDPSSGPLPDLTFDEVLSLIDPYKRGLFRPGEHGAELFERLAAAEPGARVSILAQRAGAEQQARGAAGPVNAADGSAETADEGAASQPPQRDE